jgi:hypothetical protein
MHSDDVIRDSQDLVKVELAEPEPRSHDKRPQRRRPEPKRHGPSTTYR